MGINKDITNRNGPPFPIQDVLYSKSIQTTHPVFNPTIAIESIAIVARRAASPAAFLLSADR